jgi:hypothetical protein
MLAVAFGSLAGSAQADDNNVYLSEAGGNIEVWGDGADNAIVIEVLHYGRAGDAVIQFSGLFNTTVNEYANVVMAVSNLGDLVIDVRDGGENRVFIRNLVAHQSDGSLQVLGAGRDVVVLDDSEFDDIDIEGVSTLVGNDSRARAQFTVGPTPYSDLFDFDDCEADVLNVETKGGSDLVTVSGGVYGELNIDTGATSSLVSRQLPSKRVVGKLVQITAPDADGVDLTQVTVAGDLDVRMGAAADELEVQSVWIQGHTRLDGGAGVDVVNLNGEYDDSNAPEEPTQVQGGFVVIPTPVIEEIPVNPTIEVHGFETVLNFNNPN